LISFGFFRENGEFVDDTAIVKSKVSKELSTLKKELTDTLNSLEKQQRKELLVELLSKEMNI
jgi:hypothetical protein